jgi:uncharacterized RDD family membrane protein YckC
VDRNVDVRTPESIDFTYELAGLGSRFLALIIDMVLQVVVLVAIFAGILFLASKAPQSAGKVAAAAGADADKIAAAVAIAIVSIIVFTIFFGYFIIFELFWNGQSPGKRVLGIRVVRDGGFPVDFGASLVRNIIRIGELSLGFYALSAIAAVFSPENKRLGDLAAGTIVVRDERLALPDALRKEPTPAYAATLYLSGSERELIKRFLDRRDALDTQRRRELAAQLAARVRERVPPELQRLDDEPLLERL